MKCLYCILIACLLSASVIGQEKIIERTSFLFPEFTQGVIQLKSGFRDNTLLNYNVLSEQMIFHKKGKKLAIRPEETKRVDTVFISDRKFIPLQGKFVELVFHSAWDLFVEYKCEFQELGKPSGYGGTSKTTVIKNYSSFYSDGSSHQLELPEGYKVKPYSMYWIKKNGRFNKFVNLRELKKFYRDKKERYKLYLKKHNVEYKNQEEMIQFIEYLESK